ncbi:1710_t:CDS:2 [Funneliformis geosporum]|nr:1710_t:CDS:2 [Funneliformis geosporum]
MTNKSTIRRRQTAAATTTAAISSSSTSLQTSPNIDDKLELAKNSTIKGLFEEILDKYSDIKTILTIPELLAPATKSRAQGTPRPQNAYIIFRKDISKGLYILNHRDGQKSKSVIYTSKIASFIWRTIKSSTREFEFWMKLYRIACLKHSETYENYKYRPVRKKRKEDNVTNLGTDSTSNIQPPISNIPDVNAAALITTDQETFINQQQTQQEHHATISDDQVDPMLFQGITTILPGMHDYSVPVEINQLPTQIYAAPQYAETTLVSSYTQLENHFSTGLTNQFYQQPAIPYVPSTYYLQSPSIQTIGADTQYTYPSYDGWDFISQLDNNGSGSEVIDPFLLQQSDADQSSPAAQ